MGIVGKVDVNSTTFGGSITGTCYRCDEKNFESFFHELHTGLQNVMRKILLSCIGLGFFLFNVHG